MTEAHAGKTSEMTASDDDETKNDENTICSAGKLVSELVDY